MEDKHTLIPEADLDLTDKSNGKKSSNGEKSDGKSDEKSDETRGATGAASAVGGAASPSQKALRARGSRKSVTGGTNNRR
jgi:hypothetical protein